jgi:hypothetical protein
MKRHITLKIRPDGTIEGETHDIFGAECEQYLPILQELLLAKVRTQHRTDDYTRTQPIEQREQVRRDGD